MNRRTNNILASLLVAGSLAVSGCEEYTNFTGKVVSESYRPAPVGDGLFDNHSEYIFTLDTGKSLKSFSVEDYVGGTKKEQADQLIKIGSRVAVSHCSSNDSDFHTIFPESIKVISNNSQ